MNDKHPLLKFLGFAAVCLGFAAWLVVTIGNIELFEDRVAYEAAFSDATGLLPNDDVKVAGVAVGKVTGVRTERGEAIVSFSLREDVALGQDSIVSIRWRSILGQRFLYVHPGGAEQVNAGHRFPREQTLTPADFGLLLERMTPVMRALDPETGNRVIQAFAEALVGRETQVQELISDAASLTSTLADRDVQIGRLLDNAGTVVDAYVSRQDQLQSLLESFADVSSTVAARNDELENAIVRVADVQAELRSLIERNDAEIRGSIDELDGVTAVLSVNHDELERLLETMGSGIVAYHRFSRWGQWFNVRVVGFSTGGNVIATERDAERPEGPPGSNGGGGGGGGALTMEAGSVTGAASFFDHAVPPAAAPAAAAGAG